MANNQKGQWQSLPQESDRDSDELGDHDCGGIPKDAEGSDNTSLGGKEAVLVPAVKGDLTSLGSPEKIEPVTIETS